MNKTKDRDVLELIKEHNLLPVVPILEYDDNRCSWKDNGPNQVIFKTIEECNINRVDNKRITGFYVYAGEKSNIIVIDLDVDHNEEINGIKSFNDLIQELPREDHQIIDNTLTVLTKRNGLHLYFQYNPEICKKSTNHFKAIDKPGIDILTNGCLFPTPGSKRRMNPTHGDKRIGTYTVLLDNPIQEMPQSLIDLIKQHYEIPKEKLKPGRPKESSKYYIHKVEGEGRDSALVSWLGHMIKNNPNMRTMQSLIPHAHMYNNQYFTPPLDDKVVIEKVNSVLKYADPPYIDKRNKVIRGALANILISDIKYKYYMGKNYTYNGSHYEEWGSTASLRKKIYSYISTEHEDTRMANEVISLMRDKTKIDNSKDFEYITVNNGLLHLKSNKLIPHDENIFTTIKIDCDYTTDWKSELDGSNIQRFLNTSFKGDSDLINLAIEIMGMSLLPNPVACEKHILLMGNGNNGKSIYMDLIKSLHGGYISAQPTDKLCDKKENKFCTSAMIGKRLNVVDDENEVYMRDTGLWKSIVTGRDVSIEFKGQTPDNGILNILLISGTNHAFKSKDNSDGFYRRFLTLPFNQKFVDKSKLYLPNNKNALPSDDLIETNILNNEMHILLGLALEGLQRVLKRRYKFKSIKATDKTLDKLKSENDPIYEFVLDIQNGEYLIEELTGSQFRLIYERWCENNDVTPIGSRTSGENLKQYYDSESGRKVLYFNVDMPKEYLKLISNIKYSLKETTPVEDIQ